MQIWNFLIINSPIPSDSLVNKIQHSILMYFATYISVDGELVQVTYIRMISF